MFFSLRYWLTTGAAVTALSLAAAPALAQGKPTKPAPTKPAPTKPTGKPDAKKPDAKPSLADAKKSYTNGETKFKAGDYAGALADFQAADAVKATAQAARYIGLCHDKLAKYADAVAAYERFLADVPAKLQSEADGIKKRVEEIKAMPGKVKVTTVPSGALVSADGQAGQPSPAELSLTPGKHTIAVKAEGRESAERSVDVAYASTQDVSVELKELPPPPPPPPVAVAPPPPAPAPAEPPAEPRSMVPAFITGGLAVAAAGVGTVFGVMAFGDKSDFDKEPTASKADDGENHALIADMAFGVAITMGVTSAVLFLTHDDPAPTKVASTKIVPVAKPKAKPFVVTPSPIVTAHGGGAGALVRF